MSFRILFTLAGSRYDSAAGKQGKEYRFMFVRSNGEQLRKVTEIIEKHNIIPDINSRIFSLSKDNEALMLVAKGKTDGKVIIKM